MKARPTQSAQKKAVLSRRTAGSVALAGSAAPMGLPFAPLMMGTPFVAMSLSESRSWMHEPESPRRIAPATVQMMLDLRNMPDDLAKSLPRPCR